MITPERLTKERLVRELIKKHKNFLEEHRKRFEFLERMRILKDKQEQIEHWLSKSKNSEEEEKYIKELQNVDKELEILRKELNLEDKTNEKISEHSILKNKIVNEENAIAYWEEKLKSFSKENG
ncbi:MAG: hypothetical protein QXY62_00310 [Candidatus Altiarchaeota archaeon]